MAEIWDLYDREGSPTGRTMERGQTPPPGDYHLVVHIWPYDGSGRFLVQRRADHLESNPGVWAATGGAAIAGEDSLTAAARETAEELGVDLGPEAFTFGTRLVRERSFADVWFARVDREGGDPFEPGDEVAEVRWVRLDELPPLMTQGGFFHYGAGYIETVRAAAPASALGS